MDSPETEPGRSTRRERGAGDLLPSPTGARIVRRPALTFKVRRRSLSPRRQLQFDEWLPQWSIAAEGPPLDLDDAFGHAGATRPVVLDIGFGHGESTIHLARTRPDFDIIGVEVHDPGVMTVLDAIENEPLPNIRIVHGDLLSFLPRLGPGTLDGVRIFFPDPWKKPRQHHRRLVREDVVTALTDRLAPGGHLDLATDIAEYAVSMQDACRAEGRLDGGVVARPDDRPLTRFERRGLDEGRSIVDLRYRRIDDNRHTTNP